jgi:hypothetical protein
MQKPYHVLSTLLALTLLLGACAPGISPQEINARVSTSVALTVAAQGQIGTAVAQTVAAQNPPATATLAPTFTPFPAFTPLATSTRFVTSGGGGGGGGGGATHKYEYACDIIHQRPFDNSVYNKGTDFDIKWTIVNTGTKTWPAGYDLAYYSGPHMTTHATVELPKMEPDDQFSVVFDAKAPMETGFQVMTWKVEEGFCWPYIAIIVK